MKPQGLDAFSADALLTELRTRALAAERDNEPLGLRPSTGLSEFATQDIQNELRSKQKVIYGIDDRQELFSVTDPQVASDADCTVSIFRVADVVDNGDGTTTLRTRNFGVANNLCQGEPFRDQPVGAFCSGFLVAPDLIATAGHCINQGTLANVRFVFGFRMLDATTAALTIDNGEIYRGTSIVGHQIAANGSDWALVRLDRAVVGHSIPAIRRQGLIDPAETVHVIGHPAGLPIKYAPNAQVRNNTAAAFFVANLDTYGGNSGSPVFNSTTHEVEGILVRGETDFQLTEQGCAVSLVCPSTGCRGEDCTRTTEFADLVPSATGRTMIAAFSDSPSGAQVRYWENWGQHPLFNGWQDDNDWTFVGDFMHLGYDQLMSVNRDGTGGRIMITDFSTGKAPAQVRYWENWGDSPLFNGWQDDNDWTLVGDFMHLGYDQLLSVNRDGNGGRIMITDFSTGQAPAQVRYWENWGDNPLFNGWQDDNDWTLVGDFMHLGFHQQLLVNRTP